MKTRREMENAIINASTLYDSVVLSTMPIERIIDLYRQHQGGSIVKTPKGKRRKR